MGIMSKFLMRRYKQGLLPPQMGAQLIHPRQLIMYDTFNRPPTTTAQGLGTSDSGHQWTAELNRAYIEAPGRVKNSASGGRTILSVDIGGIQYGFSVVARLRSSRGTARRHGVLIAYVDPDNYVWAGVEAVNLRVETVVAGETTVVASSARAVGDGADQTWEGITVTVSNAWDWIVGRVDVSTNLSGVSYSLAGDPNDEMWAGNILPGLVLPHNAVWCSGFYVVNEGTDW